MYVFLSQQFDVKSDDFKLDDLLADTLIIYALEGTDPDKELLMNKNEIKEAIKKYIKFDPQLLDSKIDERLVSLSTKPRKIKYHTSKAPISSLADLNPCLSRYSFMPSITFIDTVGSTKL